MDNKNNKINCYSLIDNNILDDSCKNTNIKNLINLSTYSDVNILNKKKGKSKKRILKGCENKKETINISNLTKLDNNINKEIIDISNLTKLTNNKEKYIECYSN